MGLKGPIHHMPKLRWTATHDVIELSVIDYSVYDYFVGQLNATSINNYTVSNLNVASLSKDLVECFGNIKSLLRNKLHINAFDFELDPSQQQHLNQLHQEWTKLHQQYSNIEQLTDKHFPKAMYQLNQLVHRIEEQYSNIKLISANADYFMPNPFGVDKLGAGWFNLCIDYNNLGRSSFQKWLVDDQTNDTDLNNFQEFYTTLNVSIAPALQIDTPRPYQSWCNQHNIPCANNKMPLANFDNIENNMLKYRQMFYKNSLVTNNFIILE